MTESIIDEEEKDRPTAWKPAFCAIAKGVYDLGMGCDSLL